MTSSNDPNRAYDPRPRQGGHCPARVPGRRNTSSVLIREARRPQHRCQVYELLGTKASLLEKLSCGAALASLVCLKLPPESRASHAAEDHPVLTHQAHLAALPWQRLPRRRGEVHDLATRMQAVRVSTSSGSTEKILHLQTCSSPSSRSKRALVSSACEPRQGGMPFSPLVPGPCYSCVPPGPTASFGLYHSLFSRWVRCHRSAVPLHSTPSSLSG